MAGSEKETDGIEMFLIFIFSVVAIVVIIFIYLGEPISYLMLGCLYLIFVPISFIFNKLGLDWLIQDLAFFFNNYYFSEIDKFTWIKHGWVIGVPTAIITFICLIFLYRKLDLKTLFPVWKPYTLKSIITDFKKINLFLRTVDEEAFEKTSNTILNKGRWRVAESIFYFTRKHELMPLDVFTFDKEIYIDKDATNKVIKEKYADKLRNVLTLSLGDVYTGFENLEVYEQCIIAIIISRIKNEMVLVEGKRTDKNKYIAYCNSINIRIDPKDVKFPEYKPSKVGGEKDPYAWRYVVWNQYKDDSDIKAVFNRHAYVRTILTGLFEIKNGVLPFAYFNWLKVANRGHWYALENVGRETTFVENMGVFNHYCCEKLANSPIYVPQLDEAIKGFYERLANKLVTDKFKNLKIYD